MFCVSLFLLFLLFFAFLFTYVIDLTGLIHSERQISDAHSIKIISEDYVNSFGIEVDMPIKYNFVKYRAWTTSKDGVLLGTFHEWNGAYYIDISADIDDMSVFEDTVKHETRHMLVEYLKDQKIIDLTNYTEQIARNNSEFYNDIFNKFMGLLNMKQEG